MNIQKVIQNIRKFVNTQKKAKITIFQRHDTPQRYFNEISIQIGLDKHNEIILQDETELELGGVNNKSFSLIYPLHLSKFINDGFITLIGPELSEITDESINFGLFMLIGFDKINQKHFSEIRHFNFISNGIEGFMIRTIPRRFWCRINRDVRKKFTLEFLGNAIMELYHQKFGNLITAMELILISSDSDLIDEFEELISPIREHLSKKWEDKINEWKKRIDCDYDWECGECPYFDTCEDVREVLEERERLVD